MKRYLYLLAIILVSCSQKQDVEILHVDIDAGLKKEFSFFDIFDRLDIIPLADSCLISNGHYSEPQYFSVHDKGYIILDEKDGSSYSFDTEGTFLGVISRKGRARNEYDLAYGIQTTTDGNLTVLDPRAHFYRYDADGIFLGKEQIEGMVAIHNFYERNDTAILFTASEKDNLHLWTKGRLTPVEYIPPVSLKGKFNAPFPFFEYGRNVFYYEGLTGNILKLNFSEGKTRKIYSWDFGRHTADLSVMETPDFDFLTSLSSSYYDCVFPFLNIVRVGDRLYATVLFHNEEHSLIFDLSRKEFSFFQLFKENVRFKFLTAKGNALFLLTEPEGLGEFVCDEILDDGNRAVMHSITQDRTAPVILKYTVRQNHFPEE